MQQVSDKLVSFMAEHVKKMEALEQNRFPKSQETLVMNPSKHQLATSGTAPPLRKFIPSVGPGGPNVRPKELYFSRKPPKGGFFNA